jgi:3',5'-cyclic AMP phosphodiesterase CpdA
VCGALRKRHAVWVVPHTMADQVVNRQRYAIHDAAYCIAASSLTLRVHRDWPSKFEATYLDSFVFAEDEVR